MASWFDQIGSALGSAANTVGNTVSGAWNSLFGNNNTSSSPRTGYDLYGNIIPGQQSQTPKASVYTPKVSSTPTSDWSKESADLNAKIASLTNQLAQQPRLPSFDIMANYNKAKQKATEYVTPMYAKKLELAMQNIGNKRTSKQAQTDLSYQNADIALKNALADNTTTRGRTGEDLMSALQQIGVGESNYLTDENKQFDTARRALQEEVAAAGGTDTGLGQQQIGTQLTDRNIASERQMTEFANQKAAKQLLASRTIDDLATSDVRAGEKKTQEEKSIKIDFDSYMADLANEEATTRMDLDLQKALDIATQTGQFRSQGAQEFIASLAGQGYRPQDIALAAQVYG